MMNFVRCGHTFSHLSLLLPSRSVAPRCSKNKPMPTGGYTSEKKLIVRPIHGDGRPTKEWTAIAWPTNIQSKTPDGKFGPATQMDKWGDCWFLATMASVANDQEGASVAFTAKENPLGRGRNAWILVTLWDVIRTEITRDGRLQKQQRAFLDALNKWLIVSSEHGWIRWPMCAFIPGQGL